jgi:hypothetical protein
MKSEKVKAIIAGLFLISATMTGVANQEVPLDFFISPEIGEPTAIIVVGSKAASEDMVSATMLAVRIATLCAEESSDTAGIYTSVHENIPLLPADKWNDRVSPGLNSGFPTVDVPDSEAFQDWEQNSAPINYTLKPLWFVDSHSQVFWSHDDGQFQPWETHEEIQIRFDLYKTEEAPIKSACESCIGNDVFSKSTVNPDVSSWYSVPGTIYRIDNIFVPPSVIVEATYSLPGFMKYRWGCFASGIFAVPEPWLVMQKMLPQFNLFNSTHTVIGGGPVLDMNTHTGEIGALHGTPCVVTGEPHFETGVRLYRHESVEFGSFTIELMDIDTDHYKGLLRISEKGKSLNPFWMLMNPQYGFPPNLELEFPFSDYPAGNDMNNNGVLDPGEITNMVPMPGKATWEGDFIMWIADSVEGDTWAICTWEDYTDEYNHVWRLFGVTDMVIDGVSVFTDDQGTGVEIQVYWVENQEVWYNHVCGDPWNTELNNYQLFVDAYQAGWDEICENTYLYQPPGTGMWPLEGLNLWKSAGTMFIGNGFLDSNDGHTGYEYYLSEGYFPEQHDLDRDKGTTNDCRNAAWELQESCQDHHDIEDPVVQHGKGVILVELNISLCEKLCPPDSEDSWVISGPMREQPYFTIEVLDMNFCDNDGMDYNTLMELVDTTKPVDIDETGLVFLDIDIDFTEWKSACRYNLILIGGPVANTLVNHLVIEGISAVNWTFSAGEWEYIAAPYSDCHILIVAGSDRDATKAAVLRLIDYLET